MFNLHELEIPGCYEVTPPVFKDLRGKFVKVFEANNFSTLGLESNFTEDYYTISRKNVIRGMHFQHPPHDHAKIVHCVSGRVMDGLLDLRKDSLTYGKSITLVLSALKPTLIYVPRGVAHGFCVLSKSATLIYKVSSSYSPENDAGIHYSSCGIKWPVDSPIISERDLNLPYLKDFESPF